MAVLDLKVWTQEINGKVEIVHSFYKKKCASPFTILKRSALAYKIKRHTLLQEALRRLGSISSHLPFSEVVTHMCEYTNMLRISGYSEKERRNFVVGALKRHRRLDLIEWTL